MKKEIPFEKAMAIVNDEFTVESSSRYSKEQVHFREFYSMEDHENAYELVLDEGNEVLLTAGEVKQGRWFIEIVNDFSYITLRDDKNKVRWAGRIWNNRIPLNDILSPKWTKFQMSIVK